jgi:hypothetical protein
MTLIIALIAMGIGALWCFFGWRFFLLLLPLWGLFVGFNVGTEFVASVFGQGTFATITSWAVGAVLALVFAVLSWMWWYFAVAVLAGSVGFAIGQAAWGLIGSDTGLIAFAIGLVVGVVFAVAVLALNVPRLLVVLLSAFGGAAAIVAGFFILTGAIPPEALRWGEVGKELGSSMLAVVGLIVLTIAGIIVQYKVPLGFGTTQYEYGRESYRYGSG